MNITRSFIANLSRRPVLATATFACIALASVVAMATPAPADVATTIQETTFAELRVQSLTSELRFEAARGTPMTRFHDGQDGFSATLSLECCEDGCAVCPTHGASCNVASGDGWKWYRRISVHHEHAEGEACGLCCICIEVFRSQGETDKPGKLMASGTIVLDGVNLQARSERSLAVAGR